MKDRNPNNLNFNAVFNVDEKQQKVEGGYEWNNTNENRSMTPPIEQLFLPGQ
jgi:hypothetical protein